MISIQPSYVEAMSYSTLKRSSAGMVIAVNHYWYHSSLFYKMNWSEANVVASLGSDIGECSLSGGREHG